MNYPTDNKLSLGEGSTPLVRLSAIVRALDWRGQLWIKAEYQNPTGSFKDRGSIAEIAEAIRENKRGVVCASTGNMAASLAVYAARVKLTCIVVVPKTTPLEKLRQAIMCGAKLVSIDGQYDRCVAIAQTLANEQNLLLCGDYEARRIGQRSIGTELADSNIVFDAFIVPVGNGTLGCAIAEGFATRKQYPSFIGVQGGGADPIYQAWKTGGSIIRIIEPKTIASAMSVGNPLDGKLTLEWVKKTKGAMYCVSDNEIELAQKLLAQNEGIFVEKTAAATVAALSKLIQRPKRTVLILTGSGLKEGDEPYE